MVGNSFLEASVIRCRKGPRDMYSSPLAICPVSVHPEGVPARPPAKTDALLFLVLPMSGAAMHADASGGCSASFPAFQLHLSVHPEGVEPPTLRSEV